MRQSCSIMMTSAAVLLLVMWSSALSVCCQPVQYVSTVVQEYTTSDPALNYPDAVVVDSQGNVFIADAQNSRVVKLASNGSQLLIFTGAEPPLQFPSGLALDTTEEFLYIADVDRVVKMNANNNSVYASFMVEESALDVAVDTAGNMYVAQQQGQRVVKLSPSGALLSVFNTSSPPLDPWGVQVDSSNTIWIADGNNNRAVRMAQNNYVLAVYQSTVPSQGLTTRLCLDWSGNVYLQSNTYLLKMTVDGGRLLLVFNTSEGNLFNAVAIGPSTGQLYAVQYLSWNAGVIVTPPLSSPKPQPSNGARVTSPVGVLALLLSLWLHTVLAA
jgi:sugar lactone lactonase YvrE